MDVTVAICTWNRAGLLRRTLEEMRRLVIPKGVAWELIVVNNNCSDNTDGVTESFSDTLPLRRLWEKTPGKSHALNLAVREAKGEFILWTDDDALVDPDWIQQYLEAFRRWENVDIFGGRVDPWFEIEPPAWFRRAWPAIKNAYAVREIDGDPRPFTTKWPYGVNLAFRTASQRMYHYDPELGRQPGSTIGGEEVDLVKRMLAAGYQGWWLPQAKVRHYIPKERLSIEYLQDYFYGIGLARANMWSKMPPPKESKKLWKLRVKAATEVMSYYLRRLTSSPEVWGKALVRAQLTRGWRDELRKLDRELP